MGFRRLLAASVALLPTLAPSIAAAETPWVGPPQLKLTETAVFNYRFDNRDQHRQNDKYGEWINRLNVQTTTGRFTVAVRLDSSIYLLTPDPNRLAREALEDPLQPGEIRESNEAFLQQKTQEYGRDLSTRYRNTIYPAKMYVTYAHKGLDVTVGDYYAQLGRGLVLAVRKVDELAVDTTIRGAKVDYKPTLPGDYRLTATALAGLTNPLRVDDVSGRQLTHARSSFERVAFPLVPEPHSTFYLPNAQPSFAEDRLLGGRVEGGLKQVLVGVNGVQLDRSEAPFQTGLSPAPARNARRMPIASASVNLPSIAKHGSFYLEGATQRLDKPIEGDGVRNAGTDKELLERLSGGYAFYGLATAYSGPFTLSVEGKHYERFYPLSANVANVSEFAQLQYNAVPTTEPIVNDTQFEQFNVCVTGGRTRLDYRASGNALVYASLGRYVTYTERSAHCGKEKISLDDGTVTGPIGKVDAIRNDVWDPYVGFEVNTEHNRTHAYVTTGIRVDDAASAVPYDGVAEPTTLYYREHYVRYDMVKKVFGPWSVQAAGFHRYRHYPLQVAEPWREGENYLSVIWSPNLTAAFGYEYTTKGGPRTDYFNGMLQYRITTNTVVRTFVGQTRPALRCVSGVCRQFPAFEGAKLEIVVRL